MKFYKIALILNLIFISNLSGFARDIKLIEKRKDYNFEYSTSGVSKLEITNQFGEVKVMFWNQNKIQTTVHVIANAPNNVLLNDFISSVKINGNRKNSIVSIKTEIQKTDFNLKKLNTDKNTNFKIDYLVFMPNNLELCLTNSFGEVTLPEFTAPLSLNLNYCTLKADKISNKLSNINLNYGKANIKSLLGGEINSNFTAVSMGEVRNVNLKNNNGSFKAKYLEDIDGILNYSGGVFENIKEAVKLKVNFSNDLKINNIDEKVKNLEIFSNYSNISLPISEKFNGIFDIKTNHGNFWVDPSLVIHFIKNSETDNQKPGFKTRTSNAYQGTIGSNKNSESKIIIISNYGDVKIK
ncbi:hypothetical protein [Lacihabitans sp. LS3-19]|uniref:hypothetical protein n=1 Tax=Lacihabitans sp. LS3-19 TaxID=2487335 RepID=UPI0020CEABB0|nr:hypothetical protein [Lacihabitans sp. LS3-19]